MKRASLWSSRGAPGVLARSKEPKSVAVSN